MKSTYILMTVVMVPMLAVVALRPRPKPESETIQGTAWILLSQDKDGMAECDLGFADVPAVHFKAKAAPAIPKGRVVRIEVAKGTRELLGWEDIGPGQLEDAKEKAPWWNPSED